MQTTGKRRHNREATEQQLLDACGSILLRDGPEGIRVNSVVKEAGVGKDLIYRYFGGLPGLVKTWLERDANWPTVDELTYSPNGHFTALDVTDQVRLVARNYVRALRKRPVIMRILASEIMRPTAITAVLEAAGDRIGRQLYQSLKLTGTEKGQDIVDIALVFTTMTNYFCMRAMTNHKAFGMDLHDEESWERITGIMDTLIERYLH